MTSQLSLNRDRTATTRRQRLVNRAHRSATGVFANSAAVVRDLVEYSDLEPDRTRLIYNGVDLNRYTAHPPDRQRATRIRLGVPADATVIACVANFHPYKGHLDLIRAFALLDPAARGLSLVLAGRDAGAEPRARAAAAELGVADAVRFVGQLADVEDLLPIAALVVHPSHQEGFANAIIEAMSAGRPVVACDVGGNAEAIVDGTTGRLVPAGDVAGMAAAMRELLDEPDRARAMGCAGRARAEELYGVDRMVDDFAGWYAELVRRSGRRRRDSYTRTR